MSPFNLFSEKPDCAILILEEARDMPALPPQQVLKAQSDLESYEQMRGKISFPFRAGSHKRVAVKVIDFRGNEVIRVVLLEKTIYQ
jgi:hypothetical protein